ncbi:MAG: hypothetical protein N2483_06715 [Burkholderiaceae bacterium]|nr:hypothetical protein [Burkholderiaceae bacterium]
MIQQPYPLTPTGELDVYWNFEPWFAETGDSDSVASFTVTPGPGVTKVSDDRTGSVVKAWIKWTTPPALPARSYVDCEIVSVAGRKSGVRRLEIVCAIRGAS